MEGLLSTGHTPFSFYHKIKKSSIIVKCLVNTAVVGGGESKLESLTTRLSLDYWKLLVIQGGNTKNLRKRPDHFIPYLGP